MNAIFVQSEQPIRNVASARRAKSASLVYDPTMTKNAKAKYNIKGKILRSEALLGLVVAGLFVEGLLVAGLLPLGLLVGTANGSSTKIGLAEPDMY